VGSVSEAIPDDPNADFWKKIAAQNVPLMGQVIIDPRNFNPVIDMVSVRAAYSDKEVAFHLSWDDPTESKGDGKQTFPDAIELQFPPQITAGTERPYFLRGDDSDAVYLLRWEQGKGVAEASASGADQDRAESPEARPLARPHFPTASTASVIKRPLAAKGEGRPTFAPAVFTSRGVPRVGRAARGRPAPRWSLTSWYYLRLEEPQSSRKFIIPPSWHSFRWRPCPRRGVRRIARDDVLVI
jgi:DMSO reductase family type II enzyme heme b subunit